MHELSLIQNVMQSVEQSAKENGIKRVTKIKLIVGKMTAALPDALEFGFAVLSKGTIFEGAALVIEEKEIVVSCRACGGSFSPGEIISFVCPHCGSRSTEIVAGKELSIAYFEGDEEGDNIESNHG